MPNQLIKVSDLHKSGIVRDTPAISLPPQIWTNGRNVRFEDGTVEKMQGEVPVIQPLATTTGGSTLVEPTFVQYWPNPRTRYYVYADDTNVYIMNAAGQVQRIGTGFTAPTDTNRARWQGTLFTGGFATILNNGVDAPQFVLDNTGAGTNLSLGVLTDWNYTAGTTYSAGVIRSFRNVLIAGNITSTTGSTVVNSAGTIRVSSQAAPGSIPQHWDPLDPANDVGAEFELSDTSGIVDIVPLQGQAIIYSGDAIFSLQLSGGNVSTNLVAQGYGALTTGSVIEFDGKHLVVDRDDIFLFGGHPGSIQSLIDGRLRRYFYNNLHPDFFDNLFIVRNKARDEIWVCYPTVNTNIEGDCNEALIYNYRDNTWTIRDLPNTRGGALGPITGGGIGADTLTVTGDPGGSPTPGGTEQQTLAITGTADVSGGINEVQTFQSMGSRNAGVTPGTQEVFTIDVSNWDGQVQTRTDTNMNFNRSLALTTSSGGTTDDGGIYLEANGTGRTPQATYLSPAFNNAIGNITNIDINWPISAGFTLNNQTSFYFGAWIVPGDTTLTSASQYVTAGADFTTSEVTPPSGSREIVTYHSQRGTVTTSGSSITFTGNSFLTSALSLAVPTSGNFRIMVHVGIHVQASFANVAGGGNKTVNGNWVERIDRTVNVSNSWSITGNGFTGSGSLSGNQSLSAVRNAIANSITPGSGWTRITNSGNRIQYEHTANANQPDSIMFVANPASNPSNLLPGDPGAAFLVDARVTEQGIADVNILSRYVLTAPNGAVSVTLNTSDDLDTVLNTLASAVNDPNLESPVNFDANADTVNERLVLTADSPATVASTWRLFVNHPTSTPPGDILFNGQSNNSTVNATRTTVGRPPDTFTTATLTLPDTGETVDIVLRADTNTTLTTNQIATIISNANVPGWNSIASGPSVRYTSDTNRFVPPANFFTISYDNGSTNNLVGTTAARNRVGRDDGRAAVVTIRLFPENDSSRTIRTITSGPAPGGANNPTLAIFIQGLLTGIEEILVLSRNQSTISYERVQRGPDAVDIEVTVDGGATVDTTGQAQPRNITIVKSCYY